MQGADIILTHFTSRNAEAAKTDAVEMIDENFPELMPNSEADCRKASLLGVINFLVANGENFSLDAN